MRRYPRVFLLLFLMFAPAIGMVQLPNAVEASNDPGDPKLQDVTQPGAHATFAELAEKAGAPLSRQEIDAFYIRGEKHLFAIGN